MTRMKRKPKTQGPMATSLNTKGARRTGLFARSPAIASSVGVVLLALVGTYVAWHSSAALPVRAVFFKGSLHYTSRDDLAHLVQGAGDNLSSGIWQLDLDRLRASAMRLPWVRGAAVRRVFPDRVEITIEEHQPVAYWQDKNHLVNSFAEVFRAVLPVPLPLPLPLWVGPPDSAAEVMQNYARFSEILSPVGAQPAEVRLSARRAWQIKLDNGAVLELGRADTQARLARFVKAQSRTPALQVAGLHADLRYGSGLALRNSSESAAAGFEKATRK